MQLTDTQARELGRRLLAARSRLLAENGFYGLLLMHMSFAIGDELDTAWVDTSDTITFNPEFASMLSADELCYVLEHEVLHAALGHLRRDGGRDPWIWNIAADIVVNSNIMHSNGDRLESITLACEAGEALHVTPDGQEGWHFTAEEVYEMLLASGLGELKKGARKDSRGENRGILGPGVDHYDQALDAARACGRDGRWDWHILVEQDASEGEEVWGQRVRDAAQVMKDRDPSGERGLIPACVERYLGELADAQGDWRMLLAEFVQEEVNDYSFLSPDRRMSGSPFLLPSFDDTESSVRGIVFAVDASGSVNDAQLTAAFGEVVGALEQFGGKLEGWVEFFDVIAYEPTRFGSPEELLAARPQGGGGTRFEAVFEGIDKWLSAEDLSCIVVITDGCAPCPEETMAHGVPVLWLITDGDSLEPMWGRVVRLDL